MSAAWWQNEGETLILKLYCQPEALRDAIEGRHGERLKVRLGAPAIDGKANERLRRFLALEFTVARREVTLLSGERPVRSASPFTTSARSQAGFRT